MVEKMFSVMYVYDIFTKTGLPFHPCVLVNQMLTLVIATYKDFLTYILNNIVTLRTIFEYLDSMIVHIIYNLNIGLPSHDVRGRHSLCSFAFPKKYPPLNSNNFLVIDLEDFISEES